MIVTVIIIISKVVGFVREMVLAAYFGLSVEADAYSMAFTIVNVLVLLFSAGIASTFIPLYTKIRYKEGETRANRYAGNILNLYILCALAGSVLGYLSAPYVCGILWEGSAQGLEIITRLTRLMYPALVFWAMSGVFVNILNAREKFVPEQLMGFALSFAVIVACVVTGTIDAVAIATAFSALLQVLILLPFLKGMFKYRFRLDLSDKNVGLTFRTALPALVSMGFDEISHLVDRNIGSSFGDGAVSSLAKSYSLVMLGLGVLVVPITTIMYSKLSKYAVRGEKGRIIETIKQCTEILALVLLPVMAMAILLRIDLITVLYQRGKFTHADVLSTAGPFALYFIGLFSFGLRNFQTRVFFSLRDTKTPMLIGLIAMATDITLNIILSRIIGVQGLTLATSIGATLGALIMLVVLRRKLGKMKLKRTILELIKIVVSTLVSAVVMYYVRGYMMQFEGGLLFLIGRMLVCGIAGLIAYIACAYLLRVRELRAVAQIIKKRTI